MKESFSTWQHLVIVQFKTFTMNFWKVSLQIEVAEAPVFQFSTGSLLTHFVALAEAA